MAIVVVGEKVTKKDIQKASEEYGEYIKIVVDIKTEDMTIGGEWHADAEKKLAELGSKQDNIWGGGIDMKLKKIETIALINIRPKLGNDSQELLDKKIREEFTNIVKKKFGI